MEFCVEKDCDKPVASKFFPMDGHNGEGQYPLCETDYFRRLDLLCHECGRALRGSYITALGRKYHIDHFRCSECPTFFGAHNSYYEYGGEVYCEYHFSQRAHQCDGCKSAILKQYVEIFRNDHDQFWHPECYMIHKFWNVRLASDDDVEGTQGQLEFSTDRDKLKEQQTKMEHKASQVSSVLSAFEESTAVCITDIVSHISNKARIDSMPAARKVIWLVGTLLTSADPLTLKVPRHEGRGKPPLCEGLTLQKTSPVNLRSRLPISP